MSIFDKMFGHEEKPKDAPQQQSPQPPPPAGGYAYGQPPQGGYGQAPQGGYAPPPPMTDQQAIARYQYMLKTAPPEAIEQAHQEAFAQLTPQQRATVLQQLTAAAPPAERPAMSAPGADDPQNLARMATRAEVRQPGTMERIFGGGGGSGPGMGAVIGGSLLTSLAGGFIGSAIADHFFNNTQAGRGFFGGGMGGGMMGGPGFGGGYGGGGFGGPQIINETNYYGGAPGASGGRDNEVSDNADDGAYDASASGADDQASDDSDSQADDQVDDQSDDSSYDDSADNSSSDDSGGYDDSSSDN
jgi:hypothetical protein